MSIHLLTKRAISLPVAASILVLLAPAGLHALEKPTVAVEFELLDRGFRASFHDTPEPAIGSSELDALNAAVSAKIAAVLANEIGFVHFSTNPQVPFRLRVTLEGEQTSNPNLVKTFYRISMNGLPEIVRQSEIQWAFRSDQDYRLPIDPQSFDDNLARRFAEHAAQRKQELIDAFFSHLPVAEKVLLIIDPPDKIYCAFPVTYDQLRAHIDTTFRVKTRSRGLVPEALSHFTKGLDVSPSRLSISVPEAFFSGVLSKELAPPPLDSQHSSFREILPSDFDGTFLEIQTDGVYIYRYVGKQPTAIVETGPLELQL